MKAVYTFADLQSWETATADEEFPLRLAVIGDPVAHSASPQMHNAALATCDLPMRYCRLHLHPEELTEALKLLPTRGFVGINCTIPHKGAVLAAVDEVDPGAAQAGGVNTVVIEPGTGKLRGFSTDGPGLERAVREQLEMELRGARVLILGAAGGAGRAVAMQCASAGVAALTLVNRSVEKLAPLQQTLTAAFPTLTPNAAPMTDDALALALPEIDLVINCSALGMDPADPSPVPAALLTSRHRLYDTIYTANRTPLMRAGDEAGARSANGLAMLLHQGALSFEHWFHRPAPLEVMREALILAKR